MIKLHFLEVADPVTGFGIRAGFTYNGKRYLSLIISQNGTFNVRTGSAAKHDLLLNRLSDNQISAAYDFLMSDEYAVEYAAPIQ